MSTLNASEDFGPIDDHVLDAVIAASPLPVLVALARQAAKTQHLRVLERMTQAGCFDLRAGSQTKSSVSGFYQPNELPLVAAWAHVLESAVSPDPAPDSGFTSNAPRRARVLPEISDAFKQAFLGMLQRFWGQGQDWLDHKEMWATEGVRSMAVFGTLLSLGAAACAMDHVEATELVLQATRQMRKDIDLPVFKQHALLLPTVLGLPVATTVLVRASPEDKDAVSRPLRVSPWALCLEFDAPRSLQAVRASGFLPDPGLVAGRAPLPGPYMGERDVSAAELMAAKVMGSSPANWRRLDPARSFNTEASREAMSMLTTVALKRPVDGAWLDAVLDTGLHRLDIRGFFKECMLSNRPEAMARARPDFPWHDESEQGHVLFALAVRARLERIHRNGSFQQVIAWAIEDGRLPDIVHLRRPDSMKFGLPQQTLVEFLAHLANQDAIVQLIDHGYDPRQRSPRGLTLIQSIEHSIAHADQDAGAADLKVPAVGSPIQKQRLELLDVVRSCVARLDARDAIQALAENAGFLAGSQP